MERWQTGRRKAGVESSPNLVNPLLPRSRGANERSSPVRLGDRCKLRGCDLVKIRIGTLVAGPTIRPRSMVIQQKTGRPVQFEITADARNSLLAWLERRGGTTDDFAFPCRTNPAGHLSTRQYARLVDEWVVAIGLRPEEYGTHSLRRTKASLIYKATGTCEQFSSCSGIARSRTPFGTRALMSTTHCPSRKPLKSDDGPSPAIKTRVGEAPPFLPLGHHSRVPESRQSVW